MGAMTEEVSLIAESLLSAQSLVLGNRTYHIGHMSGHDIYLAFSRWGKVAAATTATTLITKFEVDLLIFTGVAGAIDATLNVGDVVIANKLFQHDMDATPFYPKFQIPLTSKTIFSPPDELLSKAKIAAESFLITGITNRLDVALLKKFGISAPKVRVGTIASGDKFVSRLEDQRALQLAIPGLLAVEMEGAAVAQVCEDNDIPYLVIRTISDSADHNSHIEFPAFVESIANHYSVGILKNLIVRLE